MSLRKAGYINRIVDNTFYGLQVQNVFKNSVTFQNVMHEYKKITHL
jgi:hypothetical protein